MNKRVIAFSLAVLLSLALAACGGQSSPADSPATDAPTERPTPQPDNGLGVKTEAEIIADLTDSKEDFFGLFDIHCHDLDGNFDTDYTIDTLTIDRRKSDVDAGTDNVYVTVVANNLATKFTGEFHLLYELYDVGGWHLESIELESETYEPLDELGDVQILFELSSMYYEMGADESNFTIREKNVDGSDASVTVSLDYSDGVISVQGPIYLTYYHDGVSWVRNDLDCYDDLTYDILAEGTYKRTPNDSIYPEYLVFNHENGEVVIRLARAWMQGIDGFSTASWAFDCATRSYVRQTDQGSTLLYRFTPEGTIDHYRNGEYMGTFTKIAEPITDIDALYALERGNS